MSENKHTPGPWRYEPGGGHAYNRIIGSESVQVNGWPEPINGVSNASYSDRICENLGDINLPGPAANARLIAAAPELLAALDRIESEANVEEVDPDDCRETIKQIARAAIDKALGR